MSNPHPFRLILLEDVHLHDQSSLGRLGTNTEMARYLLTLIKPEDTVRESTLRS